MFWKSPIKTSIWTYLPWFSTIFEQLKQTGWVCASLASSMFDWRFGEGFPTWGLFTHWLISESKNRYCTFLVCWEPRFILSTCRLSTIFLSTSTYIYCMLYTVSYMLPRNICTFLTPLKLKRWFLFPMKILRWKSLSSNFSRLWELGFTKQFQVPQLNISRKYWRLLWRKATYQMSPPVEKTSRGLFQLWLLHLGWWKLCSFVGYVLECENGASKNGKWSLYGRELLLNMEDS